MSNGTWRGAVSISSSPCDECGNPAPVLFRIERNGAAARVCRDCMLRMAVRVIDRRGDVLGTPKRIAYELDLLTAIALHSHVRDRQPGIDYGPPPPLPPFPADYSRVLAVLDRLARADWEFGSTIAELRERYEAAACFSPKQMLLIQWRLAKNGIEHEPHKFAVSLRDGKEIAQLHGFDEWRRKKLAPFLTWDQRSRFGI